MFVLMKTFETNPQSIRLRAAGWSITCAVGAAALMALAQLTQPEVAPSWQPPSELALGRTGWAMTSGFLLLGVACLLLFLTLRGQAASRVAHVGRYALLVAALGGLMAGVFPTDRWDAAELSATGMAHSAAPVLLNAIPVASVILGISFARRSTGWHARRWWLWTAALLVVGSAIALSVSMGVLMPESGGLGPDTPVGWQARILLVAEATWIAVMAASALAVREAEARTTTARIEPTLAKAS